MALALSPACYAFTAPAVPARAPAPVMETKADLEALAVQLNPAVGFWDPLKLSEANLWGQGEEATIGWIRESEIKHGRIAMLGLFGFVSEAKIPGSVPFLKGVVASYAGEIM